MRPIWSGALSFGLVNIPVKIYSASQSEEISFDMLHKKDMANIRYARVCKKEEKEVPYEEIIKGFEIKKGQYVALMPEDFKKANVKKTQSIEIVEFSNEEEIDTIYFEKPYYLEPQSSAEKPYALLREALKSSKKVGIGRFVMRNREKIAVIKPLGHLLILNQLRYQSDIRSPIGLNTADIKVTDSKELEIAISLIKKLTEQFKPQMFKDTYQEELKKLIAQKAKGIKIMPKGEAPKPTEVGDLMAKLKASLASPRPEM